MTTNVQLEHHPWMKGFTYATLVSGVITAMVAISLIGGISNSYDQNSAAAAAFWTSLVAILMIWGPVWLLKKSASFTRWSTLTDSQKLLGYLIIFVGFYAGIIVIVALAAAKSELSRHD